MDSNKTIGIWMDHSTANLIDLNSENRLIQSQFPSSEKEIVLRKGEKRLHHKEQQMQDAYFKEIAKEISGYDHIVIFGPTEAKTEFHHYLIKDANFKNVQIDLKSTDKMTAKEKEAFVKKYFFK